MSTKEYSNPDLTVVWKPDLCIHAAKCVEMLPSVYNPEAKPWIKIGNATAQELKTQISACPSGALSYIIKGEKEKLTNMEKTTIDIKPNGPLLVTGEIKVTDAEGNSEIKTNKTAFCRCGASNNKPYCDGTHSKIGFEG